MKVDAKQRRNGPRLYGIRSINVAVSEFIVITHPQVDAMEKERRIPESREESFYVDDGPN